MTKPNQRTAVTPTRTSVEWAWEFLRHNREYQRAYEYWADGLSSPDPLPKDVQIDLRRMLGTAGLWERRFRPWLEAALETRYPLAIGWLIDRAGRVHPIDASVPATLGPDVVMLSQANRILDPMNFSLNKWLDPRMTADQHGVETLRATFDPNSLVVPPMPRPGTTAATALAALGLIEINHHEGQPTLSVISTYPHLELGEETVAPRLALEFDVTLPLLAQLQQAYELLSAVKENVRNDQGGVPQEFKEIGKPDEGGVYSQYLFLLNERAKLKRRHPKMTDDAVTMRLLKPFNDRFFADGEGLSQGALLKQLRQAKFIRDTGFRHLAFL